MIGKTYPPVKSRDFTVLLIDCSWHKVGTIGWFTNNLRKLQDALKSESEVKPQCKQTKLLE